MGGVGFFERPFLPPFEPGRLVMLMPADLDLFASAQRDIARESSFLFAMFFISSLYRRRFELRSAAPPAIRLTRGIPRAHNYIPHPLTDTR